LVRLWLACLGQLSRLFPRAVSLTGQLACQVALPRWLAVQGRQVQAVLLLLPALQVRVRGQGQQVQQACLQEVQASSSSSSLVRLPGVTSRLALQHLS
jgi:hypothetical protein